MAKKKKQFKDYVSPIGTAIWPHLNKPDTKFDAKGSYHVKLAVEADEAEDFIETLQGVLDAYVEQVREEDPKKKKWGVANVYEEELNDEGEETGRLIFNFKKNASFEDDEGAVIELGAPNLFDSFNRPITDRPFVRGGSKLRTAGYIKPYAMSSTKQLGLSLKLQGVQIIELVEGGNGPSAEMLGFGKIEGGFAGSGGSVSKDTEIDDEDDGDEGDDEEF